MPVSSGVWYTGSVFFVALIQHFGRGYASTAGIFSLFTILYGIWGSWSACSWIASVPAA